VDTFDRDDTLAYACSKKWE